MTREVSVALGLGSSMGDRAAALLLATRILDAIPGVDVSRTSRIVSSAPAGTEATRPFLNAVVRATVSLRPDQLLAACRAIEHRIGRRAARRWADRIIDVDVLLYGGTVIVGQALRVPHPSLNVRPFVLQPLLEVWPDARDPWTGRLLSQIRFDRLPVVGVLPRPSTR